MTALSPMAQTEQLRIILPIEAHARDCLQAAQGFRQWNLRAVLL